MEVRYNEGIFAQIERKPFITDLIRDRITMRDILIFSFDLGNKYEMPYSANKIKTEEELDIELVHYNFLRKYNLL